MHAGEGIFVSNRTFLCRTGHFCVEPCILLSNRAFLCRTSVIINDNHMDVTERKLIIMLCVEPLHLNCWYMDQKVSPTVIDGILGQSPGYWPHQDGGGGGVITSDHSTMEWTGVDCRTQASITRGHLGSNGIPLCVCAAMHGCLYTHDVPSTLN